MSDKEEKKQRPGSSRIVRLARASQNRIYLSILLTAYFSICIADFVTDWLLYADISRIRSGLVYGHIHGFLLESLLVINIIGSLLFCVEIVFYILECVLGHQLDVSTEVLRVLVMWLENLPQIVINAIIAGCHEYSVSILQLIKAAFLMILVLSRIIFTILKYCIEKEDKSGYANPGANDPDEPLKVSGKTRYIIRWFLCTALIGHVIGSLAVFQFTFSQTYRGYLEFKKPSSFMVSNLDPHRYFNNIGIYLDGRTIIEPKNRLPMAGCSSLDNQRKCLPWVKLLSFYDAIRAGKHWGIISQNISHWDDGSIEAKKFYASAEHGLYVILTECYKVDANKTGVWSKHLGSCIHANGTAQSPKLVTKFDIRIAYRAPNYHQQFGEMLYQSYTFNSTGAIVDQPRNLYYFKKIKNGTMMTQMNGNEWQPYYLDKDIEYVNWKTGFMQCRSTAKTMPRYAPGNAISKGLRGGILDWKKLIGNQ